MKYLDEAGLSYLLSKLKETYALKGEAGGGEARLPTWHTGTKFTGTTTTVDYGKICALGDYYLNTDTMELYQCYVEEGNKSWMRFIAVLDLNVYATKEELRQIVSIRHINAAIIALDSEEFENDGQPHAPKVRSVTLEGQPLTENVDYALVPIREASAAGTYSVIALGIGQYAGAVSKAWRVNKRAPNLRLSQPSLSVKGVMGTTDSSITITRDGSGRLSAESLAPQCATATVVGSALRVTSVKPGSATIVVRVDGDEEYDSAEARLTVDIQRADGSISVQPQEIEITGPAGATATATITKTGSGAVSVSSSPCVTSRISGNQLTLTSVSSGSANLTLSLTETDDYTAASYSVSVQVTINGVSTTLANNSWETILETAAKGEAQKYWKAGDVGPKVTFTLPVADSKGAPTDQTTTLTCDVRILDFDHDDLNETDEKYGDPSYNGGKNKAAISFEMVRTTDQKYDMDIDSLRVWKDTMLKTEILPIIQPDGVLMSGLRTVTKKSTVGRSSSAVHNEAERLFILAVAEILGSSADFPGEGEQYAFYKNGGSKRKQDPSGTYATWWTRTVSKTEKQFKAYQSLGFSGDMSQTTELPISICFCV